MFLLKNLLNILCFIFLFRILFILLSSLNEVKLYFLNKKLADLSTPLIIYDAYLVFPEANYLMFSFTLFFVGVLGIVFNRKNLINVMLSIELMLLGACLNFIFFSVFLGSPIGQIFALLIITVAAADSAVGLGILIATFYLKSNISFESFAFLKG